MATGSLEQTAVFPQQAAAAPPRALAPIGEPEPVVKQWTLEEYYQLGELGFFKGQRTELMGGEIMVLSPQKSLPYFTTDRAGETLRKLFTAGYWVRVQGPLNFGRYSEPEPDVSVVPRCGRGLRASPSHDCRAHRRGQ